MLGDWTPEWNRIALSITQYILKKHEQNQKYGDYITEYNEWLHWSGLVVPGIELAEWCISYIKSASQCPIPFLKEAALMDGIEIENIKPLVNS